MGDVLEAVAGKGAYAHTHGTLNTWSPPGYKPKNYTQTVWRMLRTGDIKRVIKKGKPYLRLASKGKRVLKRDYSLERWQRRPWKGKWCLVIFDIEEKQRSLRESLRRRLHDLGFGQLQRSIYITPFDLEEDMAEFLETSNLLGRAFVLSCQHRLMGDPRKLAKRVWSLDKINEKYKDVSRKIKKGISQNKIQLVNQAKQEFLTVIKEDPFLPLELLPDDWLGEKAFTIIRGLV